MGLFSKNADRKIAAYQRELIDIHYREVDTMYKKMRGVAPRLPQSYKCNEKSVPSGQF